MVVMFLSSAVYSQAADLVLSPVEGSYITGQTFITTLLVAPDSDDQVSSVEAVLSFDSDMLAVVSLDKANSVFTNWTSEPSFSNTIGTINVSADSQTPLSSVSNIISVTFLVKKEGTGLISFNKDSVKVLDDKGENVFNESNDAKYSISDLAQGGSAGENNNQLFDNVPPEPFAVNVETAEVRNSFQTVNMGFLANHVTPASLFIFFLILIIVTQIIYFIYEHRQIKKKEEKLRQETREIQEQMERIFSALRSEIYDQINMITKSKRLSAKEQIAVEGLTRALEVSENLIEKEINDVKLILK